MAATEFRYGYDLIGSLRKDLNSLRGFSTVVHELIQNAEDAGASHFWMDFTDEALWVGNNREFTRENFDAISRVGSGSKRYDNDQIGSFGVGFVSVYQITDQPEISSRGIRKVLLPLENRAPEVPIPSHRWPSTVRLPWATQPTELRERLDSEPLTRERIEDFQNEALEALLECGIFLQHLSELTLMVNGNLVECVTLRRESGPRPLLHVQTLSDQQTYRIYQLPLGIQSQQYLQTHPQARKAMLTLARPLTEDPSFQGRLFAFLPTQESTLFPFHLNADFYPNTDRKGLLWQGDGKVGWNLGLLTDVAQAMPEILLDIAEYEGADTLYDFVESVARARDHFAAQDSPLSKVTAGVWESCKSAFFSFNLFYARRGEWVSRDDFIVSDHPLHPEVLEGIEQKMGWAFAPEPHQMRAPLFERLGADRFLPEYYLQALKSMFQYPFELSAGADLLERLRPFLEELSTALRHQPELLKGNETAVRELYLGVTAEGSNRPLKDAYLLPDGFERGDLPWLSRSDMFHPS